MTTLHKYQSKKNFRNRGLFLPDQLYGLTDIPEILLQQKKLMTSKEPLTEKRMVKRLSPFLVSAVCLPFLFTYSLIRNDNDKWFLFFLLVFTEVNILFMDFALWNYYEGRKKLTMWLIELFVILGATYFYFKA